MSWLSKAAKKVGNFFKKLGKQIKTNLKHGAKYIVPVLFSAMTGGFGSGIVQSLFGGNAAGMLKGLGGKVFSKLGLKGLAPQLTNNTASKAIGSAIDAASPDIINGANAALSAAGSPVMGSFGNSMLGSSAFSGAVNTALSNALPQTAAQFGTLGASEFVGSKLGQLSDKLLANNIYNAAGKSLDKPFAKQESSSTDGGNIGDVALKLPEFGKGQKESTAVFDPNAANNGNQIFRNPERPEESSPEDRYKDELRAEMAGQMLTPEQIEELRKKGYAI